MESLESCYELHRTRGNDPILEAFQQESSFAIGRRVVVEGLPAGEAGPVARGHGGPGPEGMLLIRTADGTVAPILAGSVRADPCTM